MRKKSYLLVLIVAGFMSIMWSTTSFAAFDDLPARLPATDDTWLRFNTHTDEGDTGANDQSMFLSLLVYRAPKSGSTQLRLDPASRVATALNPNGCHTVNYTARPASDAGNVATIAAGSTYTGTARSGCINENSDIDITINTNAFRASTRFPGQQVAHLYLDMSGDAGVLTYTIRRVVTTEKIRLSFRGTDSNDGSITSGNPPRSYGMLMVPRGAGNKQVTAQFGAPCDFNGQRRIFWKGADSGKPVNNNNNVKVRVTTISGSGVYFNPDAGAGNGIKSSPPINIEAGKDYVLTFEGLEDNNGIVVWLPFDSAEFDKDCSNAEGWSVVLAGNYVLRNDGLNMGTTAGNFTNPENPNAPQPGQSFRYINDFRNAGSRVISNSYWYCPSGSGSGTKCRDHATINSLDRWWKLQPNTQTIAFDRGRTGYPDDTIAHVGTGVGAGGYINGPGWVWDTFGVAAADGGRSYCINGSLWPSWGTAHQGNIVIPGSSITTINGAGRTTSWTIPGPESRIYAPQLCVNVPFYYNLTPSVSVTGMQGGTVQQGTSPNVTATIHQDGATNGRNNTYSEAGKQKGLLQLQLAPGEVEPANKSAEALSTSNPTAWCKARTGNNADCSTPYTTGSAVGVPGSPLSENLTGTLNPNTDSLPVGTKLCYATFVQHPRNTESGDVGAAGDGRYSYSDIKCAIIVKSPKVQFLNSDVTVGRQSSAKALCSENQVADAPIITAGSPENRSPSNLYGSWVEYGAFATGKITNFGSAAVPFGTINEPRKLTFGNNGFNTSGNLGEFVYGKNCVADFFSIVKDDNTNLTSLGGAVFDPATGVLDLQQLGAGTDKTGYVAKDKNIQLGEPNTGPSAPDTTPAPTTQTIVKVNARAQNDVGNNGCPKLLVKVTDGGGHVDQDVKPICATGFQDYEYVFYQDTNGPKRVEARFINDGIVANVDRNIVLRTINVNGQDTYISSRGSNPGSSIIGGGTSCLNGNALYMYRSVSEGDPALNCFGVLINPVTAPLPPAQQQADYAPPEETTVTVTARATLATSADGTSYAPNGGCPYMYVKVTGTNGIVREHTQAVCSTSQSPYSFTVNLGGGGVASVDASFDPMDYYGGGNDRNLYVSNVKVGSTSIPINGNSGANVQLKNGTGGYGPVSSAPATCKDDSTVIFLSATNNVANGWCASVRVLNITAPVPTPTPPPSLTSDYEGFKGRSIVIYAQKTSAGACSSTSNGNITINKDLIYKKDGFGSVLDIPRITIIADCNITIADNVVDVNANLIAGDAIKTCTDKAQTQDKCNKKLTVRGAISANRLLLWRTYGADNSPGAPDPSIPAETFDLSPSQIISGYSRGARSATPSTVYEVDLPPRY